ncbi:ABC transporter permease subunit [Prosthecodimorpha staleyi]|uniref:ABC transporter permease subunit n=1 Tax=Prosthecodimorpha staleyi TaxID=2840188 RepID=A0A947D823_9HYPH|nr:ABC transporter permease subunit [Prosthecodimorpha staleyi]MBT9289917.1 ABC transporter permease subunit [Prosthecodimorpha staleyi]
MAIAEPPLASPSPAAVPAVAGVPVRPARRFGGWLGLLPMAVLLTAAFAVPVVSLLRLGFGEGGLSLEHFRRIAEVPLYRSILATTLTISALTTVLCVVLSYPVAYLMATVGPRLRAVLVVVVLLPFWTSSLVRTTAWIVILQGNGILNKLLMGVGLTSEPVAFVYNLSGVLIGMTHVLMPFVVLPLYAALRSLDLSTVQAAEGLGAGPATVFVRVVLPLTAPGAVAGATIVFMNAIGFYITPALMGGPAQTMISQVIADNVNRELNWGFAAALSTMLLGATLVIFMLFQRAFGLERLFSGAGSSRSGEPFRLTSRGRSAGGVLSVVFGLLVAIFLIAPILVVFPMSLGASPFLSFPPDDYSLRWYANFFETSKWFNALIRSLQVAGLTVAGAVVIGTAAAIGLGRIPARWRTAIETLFVLPMIVPVIILAVGLYYLFAPTGLVGTIWGLAIGHTVLAAPYVFVTVRASLKSFDPSLELAALGLGASWTTMARRILVPTILPGILAGAVFAFITSFDDVVLALFLTNIRTRTLPKLMYEGVAHEIDPTIIAAAGLIILVTVLLMLVNLLVTRRRA